MQFDYEGIDFGFQGLFHYYNFLSPFKPKMLILHRPSMLKL